MKKIAIAVLSLILASTFPGQVKAETVTEKVARTGILTVGTRFDSIPYSYVDDRGELVGYSIDILNLIKERLEKQLGKPITIQVVEANDPAARIPLLKGGQIDIACDTQFTWERDRHVDFSVSYSISGIRLLTKRGSNLGTPESLAGRRIGVIQNSTGQDVIRLVQPKATLVPIATVDEGLAALNGNRIDAIAGDSVVLSGLVQRLGTETYEVTPSDPYARYGIGCMVPENNSTFLNVVNYSLVKLMQGYVSGDPQSTKMVDRWFGDQGIVPLPNALLRSFFETIVIEHAQTPPE